MIKTASSENVNRLSVSIKYFIYFNLMRLPMGKNFILSMAYCRPYTTNRILKYTTIDMISCAFQFCWTKNNFPTKPTQKKCAHAGAYARIIAFGKCHRRSSAQMQITKRFHILHAAVEHVIESTLMNFQFVRFVCRCCQFACSIRVHANQLTVIGIHTS